MYARLRGVAVNSREALAERLLQRLGLARYADRCAAAATYPSLRSLACIDMHQGHPAPLIHHGITLYFSDCNAFQLTRCFSS
jgi:beta-phosphoglucomutase-like phosphatase (HAD superfamily)